MPYPLQFALDRCASTPRGGGLVVCEACGDSAVTTLLGSHMAPQHRWRWAVLQRCFPRAHAEEMGAGNQRQRNATGCENLP